MTQRRLSFAGAAVFPVIAIGVAGLATAGSLVFHSWPLTLGIACSMGGVALTCAIICTIEYIDARRGHQLPITRMADNGQRLLDRRLRPLFTPLFR